MQLNELRTRYRADILLLAAKHHADHVRVFGSVARDQAKADSDIDFLIHLQSNADLMDIAALYRELSELLHQPVDVVPDNSLSPYLEEQILNEAIPL